MNNMQFKYEAKVSHTGLISISVPSHMVALVLAEKLGLPMPARNEQCEVNATAVAEKGDHMVNIDYEYLSKVDSAPITLEVPQPADAETETAHQPA